MLLTINHLSHYRYDQPVPYALQRLRLWPGSKRGQKVHEWEVDVEGATHEARYVDGFGNRTEIVRHERDIESICVRARGVIETEDHSGVVGLEPGEPPSWILERITALTAPGARIEALVAAVRATDARDGQLPVLHTLMDTIHRQVSYEPGVTSVATDAEAALASGAGVCQDHAHIFISAARLLGFPARYVSGYLRLEGTTDQTASHAWAEAYVDMLGWVGFDVANAICPNENYVRIAYGLDYLSAAPVSGIRTGAAAETLTVEISVQQEQ